MMAAETPSSVNLVKRYVESLPPEVSMREEMRSFRFWKAVRTEFLATLLLVVVGCGATVDVEGPAERENDSWKEVKVAMAFGMAVATMVQCAGSVSGAHVNPAVSVALLVTRHITPLRAGAYATAQCAGAILGAAILHGLTPVDAALGGGVTLVKSQVHPSQAFGVEFLATMVVVVTVLANMESQRSDSFGLRALSIGLAYLAAHLFAFQFTGASLNPARSLGPALIANVWTNHWVYWVGPILGGIIGGFTYDYTHVTSTAGQYLQRSFRQRRNESENREMNRDSSTRGLTATSPDNDLTITSNDCPV